MWDYFPHQPLTPSDVPFSIRRFVKKHLPNKINHPAASGWSIVEPFLSNAASDGEFNPKGIKIITGNKTEIIGFIINK